VTAADVEAIERATVAAVSPRRLVEAHGWLIPLDDGAISRAKSAAPLGHAADPAVLDAIEATYTQLTMRPAFRIADVDGLAPLREALAARGYGDAKPTFAMAAEAATVVGFHPGDAELLLRPAAPWARVFSGEGFDPADGAARAAAMARVPGALFGQVVDAGEPCAVGVLNIAHGWAVISGLRTNLAHRGKGHASRLLATFARAAQDHGVERLLLQVEAPNPARALYARAGFSDLWSYRYWTKG
jgi:GNAT superfamily N-acetyltransferase